MNEDDKKIKEILMRNIYEPDSYTRTIETALYKKKDKREKSLYKLVAACVCSVIIIGGVSYAKQIEEGIRNLFNRDKGIETAMKNGYEFSPNTNFNSLEGTEITLEDVMMDDRSLNLLLKIKLSQTIDINQIANIYSCDIMITDESENILHCQNEEMFDQYCKEKKLEYDYSNFHEGYINNTSNWYIKNLTKEDNTIELSYNLVPHQQSYPKSQILYMDIRQINLLMKDGSNLILNGVWKAEANLPEKFFNREAVIYEVTECNLPLIKVTDFCVYPTRTFFEFEAMVDPIFTNEMSEEEKTKRKQEYYEWGANLLTNFVEGSYIENSKGEKFYSSSSSAEDMGTIYDFAGNYQHWNTFSLTQYDMTDTLTLYFTMHTLDFNEDVVIKLERKK